MGDLRPISLCNVAYNIIAKVLANRTKHLLDGLISENQSAFVPGRLITDNIMLAFETHHFLKKKTQGREGYAALKLDLSKAYDRVEWGFFRAVLLKFGFSQTWVKLIITCVSTVDYSILFGGGEIGPIFPQRGLRQGDPLSLYLFIFVAEGLSALIRERENTGVFQGIIVARSAPKISHLLFAEESFIFFRATLAESEVCRDSLHCYSIATGQLLNLDKSSLSFSKNVPVTVYHQFYSRCG